LRTRLARRQTSLRLLLPYSVLWPLAAAAEQVQHRITFAYHIGKKTRSWLKGSNAGDAIATARALVRDKRSEPMATRAGIVGSYVAPDEGRGAHTSGAAAPVRVLPDPRDPHTDAAATLFVPIRLGPRAREDAERRLVRMPTDGPLCLHHDPRPNEKAAAKNASFLNFSICSATATGCGSEVPFMLLPQAFQSLDQIANNAGELSLFKKWREALGASLPAMPRAGLPGSLCAQGDPGGDGGRRVGAAWRLLGVS